VGWRTLNHSVHYLARGSAARKGALRRERVGEPPVGLIGVDLGEPRKGRHRGPVQAPDDDLRVEPMRASTLSTAQGEFGGLRRDCVDGGASVGFLAPLPERGVVAAVRLSCDDDEGALELLGERAESLRG
jgi:hypothetical protein